MLDCGLDRPVFLLGCEMLRLNEVGGGGGGARLGTRCEVSLDDKSTFSGVVGSCGAWTETFLYVRRGVTSGLVPLEGRGRSEREYWRGGAEGAGYDKQMAIKEYSQFFEVCLCILIQP